MTQPIQNVQVAPYIFDHAFKKGHFVRDWIEYMAPSTSAPWEFHESNAMVALATAAPKVRVVHHATRNGQPLRLFTAHIGESTFTHKSNAAKQTQEVAVLALDTQGLASLKLPDRPLSVESFAEGLGKCTGRGSWWYVDEIKYLLRDMTKKSSMAGLESLLLSIYDDGYYDMPARSMGKSIQLTDVNLNLTGSTTEAIFEQVTHEDVTSGLLIRFAIIFPDVIPAWRSSSDLLPLGAPTNFVNHLQQVSRMSGLVKLDKAAEVMKRDFEYDVWKPRAMCCPLLKRVDLFNLKSVALSAISRGNMIADVEDMTSTLKVIERWMSGAERFYGHIGETDVQKQINRVKSFLDNHGVKDSQGRTTVKHQDLLQHMHLLTKQLAVLEETMKDRGEIDTETSPGQQGPGRPGKVWVKRW